MKVKSADDTLAGVTDPNPFERSLIGVLIVAVAAIPLIVDVGGADTFRAPKLYSLRAFGLAIAALVLFGLTTGNLRGWSRLRRGIVFTALGAVAWAAVTIATSLNPLVSAYSLSTVAATAAIFIAAYILSPLMKRAAVIALLAPAVVNCAVLALQQWGVWNPVLPRELRSNLDPILVRMLDEAALIGNRNEVATFLVLPALLSFALTIDRSGSGRQRVLAAIAFAAILAGIGASVTLSAVIALAVSLLLLARASTKRFLISAALVGILGFIATLALYEPFRIRASSISAAARTGDLTRLLSDRPHGYLAAFDMWQSRPLVGLGPGMFAANYLRFHLDRFPSGVPNRSGTLAFGEAHNDHLQVLAETGIPGYVLMLTTIVLTAWLSFRQGEPRSTRGRFASAVALPVAASVAVLALAQFPLQTAASLASYSYVAGLLHGWSEDD